MLYGKCRAIIWQEHGCRIATSILLSGSHEVSTGIYAEENKEEEGESP